MKFFIKLIILFSICSFIFTQTVDQQKLENEAIKSSYNQMYLRMAAQTDPTLGRKILFQFFLWSGIGLAFVLYFGVMAMVDMPITKNSILYAKYGISRTGNIN